VDNKLLNQILNVSYKILKKLYILILIIITYVLILIIKKLNIIKFLLSFFKVLSPLFIGILIAWLLRPIVNYLERKNIKRIFSLIIVYLTIIFILVFSLFTFIPEFIKELIEFAKILPNIINNFLSKIDFINITPLKSKMISLVNSLLINTSKEIPITFINIIKGFSTFIVGFIIGFYLLISNSIITINTTMKSDTYKLILKVNNIFRNYVKGTLLSSFIVFILTTLIFYILRLDNALLLGFICGITNIIPFVGPYIGGILPVLVAFTYNVTFGIIVLIVILAIQTIEGNIIYPIIMSKSIKVRPVISITSVLVFGYYLGFIGMIFAVPLVASIKEIYYYLIKRYNKYEKNL